AGVGWRGVEWGEDGWREAAAARDRVIAGVLGGVFWPPGEPAVFGDGFEGLCGDGAVDRAALVASSAGGGPDVG
ncbi:MAG: hypothetical protein AAGI68_14960, partial [Planctomycetota bacterium]